MAETNFIHSIIEKDLENGKYGDKVYTRRSQTDICI